MITSDKLTTIDVKKMNKSRIFRLIHYANKISRQEIADVLKLSLPTVNQNLKSLSENGLIDFVGNFESTGGRKAQAITVKGNSKCAVSVNLTDNGIRVSLVDLNGDILKVSEEKKVFSGDGDINHIADMINSVVSGCDVLRENILGVGITTPGIINDNNVLVSAPGLGIKKYSLQKMIDSMPFDCIVMNDAKSDSYAEFWYEKKKKDRELSIEEFNRLSDRNSQTKLFIMLDTGVGGSVIDDNRIRRGKHKRYGEFGHMTLYPGGKQCLCGKKGCFEAYVSSRVLTQEQNIDSLDVFFEKVEGQDEKAVSVFEEYLTNLSIGINNLYAALDCDIVLGGPVAAYLQRYEDRLKGMLAERYSFETDGAYLEFASCSEEQFNVGAALTFLGDFINKI